MNNRNKEIQKKIEKIPVVMLGSFGHAGIDWVHSLLDNHKEILIMPAFSFFRSLDRIEDDSNFNFINSNYKEITNKMCDLFSLDKAYNLKRRKIFNSNKHKIDFRKNLYWYLQNSKEKNITKKLFYGIHYSYCKIYNINLKSKKILVSHEHVSWHSLKYLKIFKAKFLFIFRDPRAVLGGGILRARNSTSDKIMNSLQFDYMLLDMFTAFKFYQKKIKCYSLLNEVMHSNLQREMMKLAKWLGIGYSKTMLKQSFLGVKWNGESSYLAKDELDKEPPNDYYLPSNVEKRWRSILSDKEILIIEVIFEKMMSCFNFKFDNKLSLLKRLKGYIYYFFTHQHQQKYFFNKYLILFRNFFRRFNILISVKQNKKLFYFK
jgi:hypothetical protein